MGATFTINHGDTLPVLSETLLVDKVPVDLTQVTSVTLRFSSLSGVSIDKTATISATPTDGVVTYAFETTDYGSLTDGKFEPGRYRHEAKITYLDGNVLSFPTSGFGTVIVASDLDA